MGGVSRLVTSVDVEDSGQGWASFAARSEAVLLDGRRVLLLDGRGWSVSGPADVWAGTSVEDVVATARTVVGPDEPFGSRSHADMAADHWRHLSEVLRGQGIAADADELERLPHDVVLSGRLLALLGGALRRGGG